MGLLHIPQCAACLPNQPANPFVCLGHIANNLAKSAQAAFLQRRKLPNNETTKCVRIGLIKRVPEADAIP